MPDLTIEDLLAMIYRPAGGAGTDVSMLTAALEARAADSTTTTAGSTTATTSSTASSGSGSTVGTILGTVLSGLPLVSGLISLFTGGSDETASTTTVAKYVPPAAVSISAGLFNNGTAIEQADTFAGGVPRAVASSSPAAAAAVNVTVQAIDSQSFLDHSDEIADAVRLALLNSHPLGDLVGQG
jgi:hypothetical protein